MIQLVKYMKGGRKQLLSKVCVLEMQKCGLMLRFPAPDNRKASYAVLVDNDSIRSLVDEMLEYLRR